MSHSFVAANIGALVHGCVKHNPRPTADWSAHEISWLDVRFAEQAKCIGCAEICMNFSSRNVDIQLDWEGLFLRRWQEH